MQDPKAPDPAPGVPDPLRWPPPRLHLHGPGRAATSLGVLWKRAGWRRISLSGGGEAGAREAALLLQPEVPWTPDLPQDLDPGTVLVIGAPDAAVAAAVAHLRSTGLDPSHRVLHLSGRLGREVLDPLAGRCQTLAAFHPLRAFPGRDPGRGDLDGALVAIDALEQDVPFLEMIAVRAGGDPILVRGESRALYHAGAMLAGNALLAVFDWGVEALSRAGIPEGEARRGLARLAGGTLEAASRRGPADALTGPVTRGDLETLAAHAQALAREWPDRAALHRGLVGLIAGLGARGGHGAEAARVLAWLADHRPR